MWLSILLIAACVALCSLAVKRARRSNEWVHDAPERTGSSAIESSKTTNTPEPVKATPVRTERPFELPTYDPEGADADDRPTNIYSTVSRMRDPKNWGQDA